MSKVIKIGAVVSGIIATLLAGLIVFVEFFCDGDFIDYD